MAAHYRRILVAATLALSLLASPAPPASGAGPLDEFDPGMIITDAAFYNAGSQTQASLEAFLDQVAAGCVANPLDGTPCLKDYVADTPAMAANVYCAAIPAVKGNTAAGIISQASTACGVNPEVMVVTIQKEQSLITASGFSLNRTKYLHATGAGCPDFTVCDASTESFFLQVYGTAQRFQHYRQEPKKFSFQANTTVSMQYHPETSCGSAKFTIRNQATANLYNYTPYAPNAAVPAGSAESAPSATRPTSSGG